MYILYFYEKQNENMCKSHTYKKEKKKKSHFKFLPAVGREPTDNNNNPQNRKNLKRHIQEKKKQSLKIYI